jgi:hypothetical protein
MEGISTDLLADYLRICLQNRYYRPIKQTASSYDEAIFLGLIPTSDLEPRWNFIGEGPDQEKHV